MWKCCINSVFNVVFLKFSMISTTIYIHYLLQQNHPCCLEIVVLVYKKQYTARNLIKKSFHIWFILIRKQTFIICKVYSSSASHFLRKLIFSIAINNWNSHLHFYKCKIISFLFNNSILYSNYKKISYNIPSS